MFDELSSRLGSVFKRLRGEGTVRERHLAHLQDLADSGKVRFAGPLFDDAGDPCGSLIVFEADDLESARALAESDPYLVEGVFDRVEVNATRAVLP